jgi:type II secretion system protein H
MRARPISQAGFTLIELMVVLTIIGIFSGLMFAEMRGTFEEALLRSTARKIVAAASLAGSKAVAQNRAHSLFVDPVGGRLQILVEQERDPVDEEKLDPRIQVDVHSASTVMEEDDRDEPTAAREERKRELERIEFFPDGTADAREITLRDRMGVELSLRINPVTGRIRILEQEAPK